MPIEFSIGSSVLFRCAFLFLALLAPVPVEATIVFIKPSGLETFELNVEGSDTISEVKTQIEQITGISAGQQVIVFSGNFLDDDRTLGDYNIQKESTLLLQPARFETRIPSDSEWTAGSVQTIRFADFGSGELNVSRTFVQGTLNFSQANATNPITLSLETFAFAPVALRFFDADSSAEWIVASADGRIEGFAGASFVFDTSKFLNALPGQGFSISQFDNNLMLSYTPIPEPLTPSLILLATGWIYLLRRRSRWMRTDHPVASD